MQNVLELRARLEAAVAVDAPAKPASMTVALLHSMYRAHAEKEYNGQWGQKEVGTIDQAFAPLVMLYGDCSPDEITPLRLRAVRHFWIDSNIARTTIQARMQRLRRAWRWARSVELIATDLPDIGTLRYGHAPEPEDVQPVDLALVESTLPHLPDTARSLIRLIMYTGMRPGEACAIRADEIDTRSDPWVYRPKHHKTAWKGKRREIWLGPKAQLLLQVTMSRAESANVTTMIFRTRSGGAWTSQLLHNAVYKACRKHGLPRWHPNQLRHTVATMLREEMGLEAAQAVLGHSIIETTQVYAKKQSALARQAALKFG